MSKQTKRLLLYTSLFLMSACSLSYMLLIAQTMTVLVGHVVKCYSVTLGIFIFAQGVARLRYNKHRSDINLSRRFWEVSLWNSCIYLAGISILFGGYVYLALQWLQGSYWPGLVMFYAAYFFIVWQAGLIVGQLSSMMEAFQSPDPDDVAIFGKRGSHSLGLLAGGIIFNGILYPLFNLVAASFIVSLLFLLALALFYFQEKDIKDPGVFITTALVLICLFCSIGIVGRYQVSQIVLKKYYFYPYAHRLLFKFFGPMENLEEIQRRAKGRYPIDLVRKPFKQDDPSFYLKGVYSKKYALDPSFPVDYRLYVNNDLLLDATDEDVFYEYFAHIPLILNNEIPKSVLIVGGGDGCLVRELLKYPQIQSITLLERNKDLVDWAKENSILKEINKGSLRDKRVKIINEDPFLFISLSDERFDAVYFDLPAPTHYDSSRMYSVELFRMAGKKLEEGGFVTLRAPSIHKFIRRPSGLYYLAEDNDWFAYYHTLKAAGFGTIRGYISNMGVPNQEAIKVLWDGFRIHQGRESVDDLGEKGVKSVNNNFKYIIQSYVSKLQSGFIFSKKGTDKLNFKYDNDRDSFYVLNPMLFHASFGAPFEYPEDLDEAKVNSIMRPTLPSENTEWVKLPY